MPTELLEHLILYVVDKVESEDAAMSTIRLVKFLYLIDVEHYRRYGQTLTRLEWVYHKFGPYVFALRDSFARLRLDMEEEEYITLEGHKGRRFHVYVPQDIADMLPFAKQALVDRVLKWWMWEDTNVLMDHVYFETEPMQHARPGDILDFSTVRRDVVTQGVEFHLDPVKAQALRERVRQTLADVRAEYIQVPASYDEAYYDAMRLMDGEGMLSVPEGTEVPYTSEALDILRCLGQDQR